MSSETIGAIPLERRASRRQGCLAPVRIYATPGELADSFVLDAYDVSASAIYLHTELLFPLGEWLELEFLVPGRPAPLRTRGRVVRVDAKTAFPGPGIAMLLPKLSAEERSALLQLAT